jgi:hypothetical protein
MPGMAFFTLFREMGKSKIGWAKIRPPIETQSFFGHFDGFNWGFLKVPKKGKIGVKIVGRVVKRA